MNQFPIKKTAFNASYKELPSGIFENIRLISR